MPPLHMIFDEQKKKEYHKNCALKYDLSARALGQAFCTRVSNIWKPVLAAHGPPVDIITVDDIALSFVVVRDNDYTKI